MTDPSQRLPCPSSLRVQEAGGPGLKREATAAWGARSGDPGWLSQPRHQRDHQVGLMKIMSRTEPQGFCFHTLKTKDATNPPLEPERGFYCLEGVPGKWGGVGRKPSQVAPLPAPSAHKAQSPGPDCPLAPRRIRGKPSPGEAASKPKQTLSVPRLRGRLAPRAESAPSPPGPSHGDEPRRLGGRLEPRSSMPCVPVCRAFGASPAFSASVSPPVRGRSRSRPLHFKMFSGSRSQREISGRGPRCTARGRQAGA